MTSDDGFDVGSRAGTILVTLLGWDAFCGLAGESLDKLVEYVGDELAIIAKHGYDTPWDLFAAPDCNDMSDDQKSVALPGMITWEDLKEAQGRVQATPPESTS